MPLLQIVLMFVVVLAFYPSTTAPTIDPRLSTWLTAIGLLLMGGLAEPAAPPLTRRVWREPNHRYAIIRRYSRVRRLHLAACVIYYLSCLFEFEWAAVIRTHWGLSRTILLEEIAIIAPFLLCIICSWFSFYRVERALHNSSPALALQPFWRRWPFVLFHIRQEFGLILVPIFVFTGLFQALSLLAPAVMAHPQGQPLLTLGVGLVLLVILPWLLIRIWPTRSLPTGSLRQQLDQTAQRLNLGYTDIRLMDTNGTFANAMVAGFLPVPRYVLLSDLLVAHLTPEEIEAVFGHEMGHVKHKHLLFYLLFMMLSLAALTLFAEWVLALVPPLPAEGDVVRLAMSGALPWKTLLAHLGIFAVGGLYIWQVFGLVSRACERQADIFGCKAVAPGLPYFGAVPVYMNGQAVTVPATPPASPGLEPHGIRVFISALAKVAHLNGIDPERPSWRHGSIGQRVRYLDYLIQNPAEESRFQRRWFVGKVLLVAALAGVIFILWRATGITPIIG